MMIIELIILLVSLNLRFYKDLSIIYFALCATWIGIFVAQMYIRIKTL